MKLKLLPSVLLILLCTSCAFNGLFYNTRYDRFASIKQSGVQNVFEFKLENKKGKKIHTAFVPTGHKQPKGSVFMLHGNAGPIGDWITRSGMFTSQGYNFYIMDYAGFGESEGHPTHKNVLRDAQLAFDHFLKLEETQNLPVIIHGVSIGGHLSVKLTAQNQSKINGLVIEEAFSTHNQVARQQMPGLLKPLAALLVKNNYPATKAISDITIPVLVIGSKQDEIAPYRMSEKLFDQCGSAKKELWDVGDEHIRGLFKHRKVYIEKLGALITP